jgi:hypothetical protein
MFPIELGLFCVFSFFLMRLKNRYPNIFFPPSNINVYLPPNEEDIKDLKKDKQPKQLK